MLPACPQAKRRARFVPVVRGAITFGMMLPGLRVLAAPNTLQILPNGAIGTSVSLTNVTFTGNFTAGMPCAGKGDLQVTVAGKSVPMPQKLKSLPFSNLIADDAGVVSGGGVVLADDLTVSNFCDTGADLVLTNGSQFLVDVRGKSANLKGTMSLKLPYRSITGEPMAVTLPGTVNIANDGFSLEVKGATLQGTPGTSGIQLAGFTFKAANADFSLKLPGSNGKKFDYAVALNNVTLDTPIPNLLSQERAPITLKAGTVGIDETGSPSITGAKLAKAGDLPFQVASSGTVPAAPALLPKVIHLTKPINFTLTVNDATVGFHNGKFDTFSLNCDVALPPQLTDKTGKPIVIKGISVEAKNGIVLALQQPLELTWNNFGISTTGFTLDFSAVSGDPMEVDEKGAALRRVSHLPPACRRERPGKAGRSAARRRSNGHEYFHRYAAPDARQNLYLSGRGGQSVGHCGGSNGD